MAPKPSTEPPALRKSTRNANGKRPLEDKLAPQEGDRVAKKAKTAMKKPAVPQKTRKQLGGKGKKGVEPDAEPEPEPAPEPDDEEALVVPEVRKSTRKGKKVREAEEAVVKKVVAKSKAKPSKKGKQAVAAPEEPVVVEAATKLKAKPPRKGKKAAPEPEEPEDPIQTPEPRRKAKSTEPGKKATKPSAPAKPKAVRGTVHNPTTPKTKLPPKFSAHRELRIDYTLGNANRTLITHLQILKTRPNPCTTTIEAEFWVDNRKGKRVGEMVAYLIDKTTVREIGKGVVWTSEYLSKGASSETAHSLKELYTVQGRIRAGVKAFPLGGEKILYLDSFVLGAEVQGQGLSSLAMEAFHALLPVLPEPWGFGGTVVLSPARPETDEADGVWGEMSAVDVERALLKVYRRCGYESWMRGDEEVEGSVTVMGRVVQGE